jgi:hypothetical protein
MGLRERLRRRRAETVILEPVTETALPVVADDSAFVAEDGSEIYSRGYMLLDPDDEYTPVGAHPWLREIGCHLCKVAGITHHPEAAAQEERFAPGSVVLLCPAPENPVDPHAVAVFDASGESQIGFVPAAISQEIAERIGAGEMLGGAILREYRSEPDGGGRRLGLVMLIAPAGRVKLRVERREAAGDPPGGGED